MIYFVVPQSPVFRQMTLEELFSNSESVNTLVRENTANTRTYVYSATPARLAATVDVFGCIDILKGFNASTEELRRCDRHSLYHSFHIPKRSGGLRKIDAPSYELSEALRRLKKILEDDFRMLHHTAAFAYVKKRSTIDAVKRHQSNESKWFGKYDLKNFFQSTTLEYTMSILSRIYPLSEVIKTTEGKRELETALELAFLDGGLPQGTPLSPTLTNIIMIPIDYEISNALRNYEGQKFVYTRYADDFIISSRYDFSSKSIEEMIEGVLTKFGAPFSLNKQKTRYGSSSGSNWNLGVMLNKDNQITVGHKNKKRFQAMLTSYALDRKNGKTWTLSDVQALEGLRSYYYMVEGGTINQIVQKIGSKFGIDIAQQIKTDLKTL